MKLRIFVAALLGSALALAPAAASAKGPRDVELTGPGLDEPIRLDRDTNAPGRIAEVTALTELTGLFSAFSFPARTALIPTAPPGELGLRYVATYHLVGAENDTPIRQELYPFAERGPVVFTPPGQSFYGMGPSHGGWQRADPKLRRFVVSIGVPSPAELELSQERARAARPTPLVLGLAGVALLLTVAVVAIGRRLFRRSPRLGHIPIA